MKYYAHIKYNHYEEQIEKKWLSIGKGGISEYYEQYDNKTVCVDSAMPK